MQQFKNEMLFLWWQSIMLKRKIREILYKNKSENQWETFAPLLLHGLLLIMFANHNNIVIVAYSGVGLTVLMYFSIKFNVQNTHVISTGQLLDHQPTLIPVQKLKRKDKSWKPRFHWIAFLKYFRVYGDRPLLLWPKNTLTWKKYFPKVETIQN